MVWVFNKVWISLLVLVSFSLAWAEPWAVHKENIQELERDIYKLEQEMDELVERKKNTRQRARIEETLQRIVEIHAELISLRRNMDNERAHLQVEHPEQAHVLDDYDSRMIKARSRKKKFRSSISGQLDDLLLKVQMKYSSFMKLEAKKKEVVAVEKVIRKKEKKKKEREADVYLRKKSKVKLVK